MAAAILISIPVMTIMVMQTIIISSTIMMKSRSRRKAGAAKTDGYAASVSAARSCKECRKSTARCACAAAVKIARAEEQAAYDEAFELLTQSRYADAVLKFRSLIESFPRGALIDDAQYWIGEAYYVVRDFKKAGEAFRAVVNRYPESERMPEAMLKLGVIQAETGRTQKARRTLNQVISRYPGSRVAISAETHLSQIR